jgi:hypothetical protein
MMRFDRNQDLTPRRFCMAAPPLGSGIKAGIFQERVGSIKKIED